MAGATSKTLAEDGPGLSEDLSSVDNLNLGYFLPYLLNRATHTVNRLISERLSAVSDITVPEWRVLSLLKARNGVTLTQIAAYTVIEHSTLSRVVNRMEKRSLIIRRANPDDARAQLIFISEFGAESLEKVFAEVAQVYAQAVANLSDDETDCLVMGLRKVIRTVSRCKEFP